VTDRGVWVVGDPQGHLQQLCEVLRSAGLIDADAAWSGEAQRLVVLGDLVDRGPHGLAVIDLLMRLRGEAARAGGEVHVVIGNHDVQLLAAHRFGGTAVSEWLEAGGVQADLDGLTRSHVSWLTELPAMMVLGHDLLVHGDALFYAEYGSTVASVNDGFREVLQGSDRAHWDRLLELFGEHRAFVGDDGPAALDGFLGTFGGNRLIHGHTPIARMLHIPPESVTSAHVYCDGRCVNVDPGIYLGGPGFAFRALP
jgi:Calcineurin-like phosphoesterase